MFKSNTLKLLGLAAALTTMFVATPSQALICQYCSYNGPSLNGTSATGLQSAEVVAVTLPDEKHRRSGRKPD